MNKLDVAIEQTKEFLSRRLREDRPAVTRMESETAATEDQLYHWRDAVDTGVAHGYVEPEVAEQAKAMLSTPDQFKAMPLSKRLAVRQLAYDMTCACRIGLDDTGPSRGVTARKVLRRSRKA